MMDPILYHDIEAVEARWGSLASPKADLTKVHKRVLQLGLVSEDKKHTGPKNHYYHRVPHTVGHWYTHRRDVYKAMECLDKGLPQTKVMKRTGLNRTAVGNIHELNKCHALKYIPNGKHLQHKGV